MKAKMIEAFCPWCPNHEMIDTGQWGYIPYGEWIHKQKALIERDKSRIAIIQRRIKDGTKEISLDVNDVGIHEKSTSWNDVLTFEEKIEIANKVQPLNERNLRIRRKGNSGPMNENSYLYTHYVNPLGHKILETRSWANLTRSKGNFEK